MQSANYRAQQQLQQGLATMAARYPWFARLLQFSTYRPEPRAGTMAVYLKGGRLYFCYCPNFVNSCKPDELCGVLHHEVNHVLFGHVSCDLSQYTDRAALTIAQEVTVNEWVGEPLPGKPMRREDFDLPPHESTERRYERLKGKTDKFGSFATLDNHLLWSDASSSAPGAASSPTDLEAARRQLLQRIFGDARYPGSTPQGVETLMLSAPGPSVQTMDWKRLLTQAGVQFDQVPDLSRPSRRLPHLVGLVAGTRFQGAPRVLAVVDTSGSIEPPVLERIDQELQRIRKIGEVIVVECDDEIRAQYRLRGKIQHVKGRGRTDLRPPFQRSLLGRIQPNVIVYFTDGQGPAPAAGPPIPVIWCISAPGLKPAAWGHAVQL